MPRHYVYTYKKDPEWYTKLRENLKGGEQKRMTLIKLSQKDKQDIDDSLAHPDPDAGIDIVADADANITDEHSLSTVPTQRTMALPGQYRGVDIGGLESIPMGMVAVPFVRLIQPTSKKTELADGSEAPAGSFLFNDIQEAFTELQFVLLRAKHEMIWVNKNGQFVGKDDEERFTQKPRVSILGITTDSDKLFILSLSATSFSSFGKLIAKLKSLQVDNTCRIELVATSEKTENKKGKFYIVNFKIKKDLSKAEMEQMQQKAFEYGVVLDRQFIPEEEE